MTKERLFAAALLIDFVALNVYALATEGLGGLWTHMAQMGPWGWVIFVDLCIALSLCMVWMWRDARRRGTTSVPESLVTLLTGSTGPLLYLVRRPASER